MKNFIKAAGKIYKKNNPIQMCLVDADSQKITFTDLDVTVEAMVDVQGFGKILAPFHSIASYINKTKAKNVEIAINNGELVINGIEFKQDEKMPVEQFSVMENVEFTSAGIISTSELDLLKDFQSDDPEKIALNGIIFVDNKIAATNGQILREVTTKNLTSARNIVPSITTKTLLALPGNWQVATGSRVQFRQGNITITTKVLADMFPDYKTILDLENKEVSFKLKKEELLDFVSNSAWVKNEIENSGNPIMDVSNGTTKIGMFGTATISRLFKGGSLTPCYVGFLAENLETALYGLSTEVEFRGTDSKTAFHIVDSENSHIKTAIMPIVPNISMPGEELKIA